MNLKVNFEIQSHQNKISFQAQEIEKYKLNLELAQRK